MLGVGPKETAIWAKANGRGHLCTLDTCLFGSSDHFLIIVYPVYVFYDQWSFCLVAMAKS